MKGMLLVLLMVMAFPSLAEEIFPAGCQPLTVSEERLVLSAEKPLLIMIHNLSSDVNLWMTHPLFKSGMNDSTELQAGHWTALALDEKSFDLSCVESRPGHEQQVSCVGLLAVCQWHPTNVPKTKEHTFWVGENMSLSALTAHVGSSGFVLPTA